MMNNKKRCIKISFQGETKRVKMAKDYDSLVGWTKEKFSGLGLEKVWPIKFYYLDDEQELISITSQSDFAEACDIMQDVTTLKLIIADNAQQAMSQMERQIGDNISMASSMNLRSDSLARGSTLNLNGLNDMLQQPPIVEQRCMTERAENPDKLEAVNLMSNMKNIFQDTISQIKGLVSARDQPVTSIKEPELPVNKVVVPSVSEKVSQPISESPNNIIQIDTMVKEDKKEENLQAPAKDEGIQGLDKDVVERVRAEVKALVNAGLKEEVAKLKPKKDLVVHKDHICDGCEMNPIVGIRYQCTMREDYDLCEKCEAKPEQRKYTFLKIRKTSQAPHSVTCKYPEDGFRYPDLHIDQTINVDDMVKKFQNFVGMFQKEEMPANNDLKQPAEVPSDLKQPVAEPELPKVQPPTELPEYEIEDIPVRDDLSQLEFQPIVTNLEIGDKVVVGQPVLSDDLKIEETAKPEIVKPLSDEERYKLEAAAETSYMQKALLQLLEFGFTGFARNKELLAKFNYNIEAVANVLYEDMELYD